jgi:hypothetical protein
MIEFLEKFMGEMGLIGKSLTMSSRTPPPLVKHHGHRNQLAPEMADIASILGNCCRRMAQLALQVAGLAGQYWKISTRP